MKRFSLADIAEYLEGRLSGDPALLVSRIMTMEEAAPGDIAIVFDARAAARIRESRASAFVLPMETDSTAENRIQVDRPRHALIQLLHLFYPEPEKRPLIHDRAVVSLKADLGSEIYVGPGAVIEKDVIIDDGCQIHANVCIGQGSRIGEQTEIFPNVTIYPGTIIGKRVRIHGGTVIGSDGFGYLALDSGKLEKIPQVGCVEIGDDVEIGANCTIDRATLGATRILSGVKIDNQVQIGHNSEIGQHCIIVAQSGISGSVRMGAHCVLAGQVGVSDHVELKPGTMVGAQSGVIRDIGPGRWAGYPAIPVIKALRAYHLLPELPDIHRRVRELERRMSEIKGE